MRPRSGCHRSLRVLLVAAAALAAISAPAWAQERVQTRAWPHPGFARIVFDWPQPVDYKARIDGTTLVIEFERPLTSDFGRIARFLDEYVSSASLGRDEKTVTVALKGAFGLRTSTSNNSIVVDLLNTTAQLDGKTGGEAQKVRVRFGEHPNFTRIVFDWTRDVGYTVEKRGESVAVRFDRAAQFDLDGIAKGQFPLVKTASSRLANQRVEVDIRIEAASRFRHFRDGTKVVVDIIRGSRSASAAKPATENAVRTPTALPPPPPKQKPKTAVPPAKDTAAPASLAREEDGEASSLPAVPHKPVDVAKVPARPAIAPLKIGEPTRLSPGENEVDKRSTPRAAPLSGVRVSVAAGPHGPVIAFEWPEPVAAAAFERAGFFWVVFDRADRSDVLPIPPDVADSVFLAEAVSNPQGSAFRFKLKAGLQATVNRDGGVWRVDFAPGGTGPADPIPIQRETTSPSGPRIFLPVEDIGRRIDLNDPEVGDRVHVIPVLGPGKGIPIERAFVEFNLLATAQGVAVTPRADAVIVRPLRDGVEISGKEGLILSALPGGDQAGAQRRAAKKAAAARETRRDPLRDLGPSLFRYMKWRGGPDGAFNDTRKRLNLSLAKAPKASRSAARWELAKFYFAYGMAADAIGITDIILQSNPSAVDDNTFKAVRGASFYLMGRLQEAELRLLDPVLGLDSGAALWRGAVFAAREDWAAARQEFEAADVTDENVPPIFRTHFQLLAARATMLTGGNVEDTEFILKRVTEETATPTQLSEAKLIRGQMQLASGDDDETALAVLNSAVKEGRRPVRPWAKLLRTDARFERGELTIDETIDELEALSHSWRGGEFEFQLLARLTDLYLQDRRFRDALATMRQTVSTFNERPQSKETAQRMNDLFRDLFLNHGADDIAPVNALALYFDFRELTPVGREGDAMIRQLADRLVEVDLLGRAAQLVQHQVTFRLKGEEKARVGTKLAAIYILDRQFDKALEALSESRWRALDKQVRNERQYLRVQARIGLKDYDEALKLVRDDESAVAATLRADIYWKTSRWIQAADSFESVLATRWQDPTPLTMTERQQIMQMTVALALVDRRDRIAVARQRYESLIAGTPDADAFAIITSEIDRSSTSFRTVASKIAQISTLESFMARYRDSLENGVGTLN